MVEERLAEGGLDLFAPLSARAYDEVVPAAHRMGVPEGQDRLAFVIGNTRGLWAHFLAAYEADVTIASAIDPLDRYVEQVVGNALREVGVEAVVYYAHARTGIVPAVQRAAALAGLAPLGPARLSVHREHGPWIAWRALLCTDVPFASPPAPVTEICSSCAAPCVGALEAALARGGEHLPLADAIASEWRSWVAVRDVCPVGRASRYGEDQLAYHYTKDRNAIERALVQMRRERPDR